MHWAYILFVSVIFPSALYICICISKVMTLFGSSGIFSLTLSYYSVLGSQELVMVLEKSPG